MRKLDRKKIFGGGKKDAQGVRLEQEDSLGVQGGDFSSGGDVIVLDVCELVVEVLIEDEEHGGTTRGGHGKGGSRGGGVTATGEGGGDQRDKKPTIQRLRFW